MYTDTGKFKIEKGYGNFTIPRDIIKELGWSHGDLLGFWGLDGEVIHIERVLRKEDYEKNKEILSNYPKTLYKKIAKIGGSSSLGVKTFPEFLLKEFKLKKPKKIYFLPAKHSWLKEIDPLRTKEVVFMTFNDENLKQFDKAPKENPEEEYRKILVEEYEPPYFNRSDGLKEKNSKKAYRRVDTLNKKLYLDRIRGFIKKIQELENGLSYVESSVHPKKRKIIVELKRNIKEFKNKLKELEKNDPEKFF